MPTNPVDDDPGKFVYEYYALSQHEHAKVTGLSALAEMSFPAWEELDERRQGEWKAVAAMGFIAHASTMPRPSSSQRAA